MTSSFRNFVHRIVVPIAATWVVIITLEHTGAGFLYGAAWALAMHALCLYIIRVGEDIDCPSGRRTH